MSIAETILPQLEHEMKLTRVSLSRVPMDRLSWRPHPKSFPFGRLAFHLAEIASWIAPIIQQEELDLNPPGENKFASPTFDTQEDLLAFYDKHVAEGSAVLSKATDEQMLGAWTLRAGEHKIFTMPRVAVIRGVILSHTIHHRAQLGLYLRMNDIAVPAIYGPSADEGGF